MCFPKTLNIFKIYYYTLKALCMQKKATKLFYAQTCAFPLHLREAFSHTHTHRHIPSNHFKCQWYHLQAIGFKEKRGRKQHLQTF